MRDKPRKTVPPSGIDLVKQILRKMTMGFAFLLVILVLDDLLDITHILPRDELPDWWIVELLTAIAVIIYTSYQTRSLAKRIQFLEGLLSICSYCKKIRQEDQWIQPEEYISGHSKTEFSHGICPDCMKEHFPKYAAKVVTRCELSK